MTRGNSKAGQVTFLAVLSLTMVLGTVRAPQIKTCLEARAATRAACFSQNVLPQISLPDLQLLAEAQPREPVPPAPIPDAGLGKPLQLGPILTS